MPLLFSYGTLQEEAVQRATFARLLAGERDALFGVEPASVPIADPEERAATGRTHHANIFFNSHDESRVSGMAFEVTDAELLAADAYERDAGYQRIAVTLASGRRAWVYAHRGTARAD